MSARDASPPDPGVPSVTVVVASNRGADGVRGCLEGLAAQDYPADSFDVVVVDDGSLVPIERVAREMDTRLRLQVVRQENAGPARARNRGASLATSDYLAFTDDDCVPARDWLRRLAASLADDPDALVGGTVVNGVPDDRYAEATHQLIAYLERSFSAGSMRRFFTTNNVALSRRLFSAVGGFDERFPLAGGEDREFCERWHARGGRLVAAPDAVVTHMHRMTLRGFVRQQYRYGRGAFHLRDRGTGPDRRLEPLRFYVRLVASPFGRMPFRPALAASALLVVSQAATAAGYARERIGAR